MSVMAASRLRGAAAGLAPPLGVVAVILALLEISKRVGWLPITVPAPSQVWGALLTSWGDLLYHAGATVRSAVTAYVLAAIIALCLGAVATAWGRAEKPIFTLGVFIDSAPLIALAPIFALWLGNGTELHVTIATIAALFPMLVGTIQGLKSAESNLRELFHVIAASRWQRFTKLLLPHALPYLFAAMKVAAPLALLGALIAEWMGTDRGLGTMITYALFSFNVPLVWLSIVAVSALAAGAYGLIALVEGLVVGWSRERAR